MPFFRVQFREILTRIFFFSFHKLEDFNIYSIFYNTSFFLPSSLWKLLLLAGQLLIFQPQTKFPVLVLASIFQTFPDGISLRVHPWGPEVCHRLPDTLPPPWGPGTQQGRGPQHSCGVLVHWRGHYPSGGQHQPGGPAEKLLLWQEDHYNTRRIVTVSEPWDLIHHFVYPHLARMHRVGQNSSTDQILDHIKLPGRTIWHVIQHCCSQRLYANEFWV